MEFFGSFWPLILAAGILGAFLAPIIGYWRRPAGNGPTSHTLHGAAIIDSSAIQSLVDATVREAKAIERIASSSEEILNRMTKTADAEAERARVEAARADEREKVEREFRERERDRRQ